MLNQLSHQCAVIEEQLKDGIVEPVQQETNNGVGKVHCLPHHEVIRVDKETTKLCVVYDANDRAEPHVALMIVFMLARVNINSVLAHPVSSHL